MVVHWTSDRFPAPGTSCAGSSQLRYVFAENLRGDNHLRLHTTTLFVEYWKSRRAIMQKRTFCGVSQSMVRAAFASVQARRGSLLSAHLWESCHQESFQSGFTWQLH